MKTSQQYTALYTILSHALDGEIRAIAANWCLVVRTWSDTPATLIVCLTLGRRHQHMAQWCRGIQPSFSKCLGIQKICLGFKHFHRNVDIKYFEKSKKKKIMIWGIHYFITKLKTEIDVIPRSCFNTTFCLCGTVTYDMTLCKICKRCSFDCGIGQYSTRPRNKVWAYRRIPYSFEMTCIFPYRTKMNTVCIFSHDCQKFSTAQISVQLTDMTNDHLLYSMHAYNMMYRNTCSTAECGIGWSHNTSHSRNTTSECDNSSYCSGLFNSW